MSAPLILAIQPDRRQASQLASIVRGLSAELILAESAEKAIAELGDRPPDLILTPPLLSPKDEKRLTDRLHEFGDAAAHTQTLTTPIFETEASPARGKGMLSSLRKPKKKGKAQGVGSAADTFAEQITIYLNRAVEARRPRPKRASASKASVRAEAVADAPVVDVPAAAPEVAAEAPPVEAMQPASATAATLEHEPEQAPVPIADSAAAGDGLPTIEELSARTPTVPEPDNSVDTNMDAIAAMVPTDAAADDRSVPTPEAMPTLAELQVEMPVMETAAAEQAAPAVPESAGQIDTTMEAVAAMVPMDGAADDNQAVPMPDAMPAGADVSMELSAADIAVQGDAMPTAPQLDESVDMTMEAVAAAVPFADVSAHERPVPMPTAMPKVADFAMELLAADMAPSVDAVPAAPEPAEGGMEAVAAMMPIVAASTDDRLVPAPTAMSAIVEFSMELPSDMAATVGQPVPSAPEPDRSIDASFAMFAAAVPGISAASEDHSVAMPVSVPAVAQLSMEVPSFDMRASADEFVPAPEPVGSFEPGVSFAALAPMVSTPRGNVLVPMPGNLPAVADLAIGLPAMESLSIDDIPAVPHAARSIDMSIDVVDGLAPLFDASADGHAMPPVPVAAAPVAELPPAPAPPPVRAAGRPMPVIKPKPMSPALLQRVRRADRKKAALQARKARKKVPKRQEPADGAGLFDPDQIQFSALIAKLDEVAPRSDEPTAAAGSTARKSQPSKTRTR